MKLELELTEVPPEKAKTHISLGWDPLYVIRRNA